MSKARQNFCDRVLALRIAVLEASIQPDPTKTLCEQYSARLLRNGLCVMCYCCLEDFLKARCAEVANELCRGAIPFVNLPKKMQKSATLGVIQAMSMREKLVRKNGGNAAAFLQEHAKSVASTCGAGYTISSLAFGFDKSNLGYQDLENMAKCFSVEGIWSQTAAIASRLGLGAAVDYKLAFISAGSNRHAAAHDPSADIEVTVLSSILMESIAIAIGFDSIITIRTKEMVSKHDWDTLDTSGVHNRFLIRSIKYRLGKSEYAEYAEYIENRTKAIKISKQLPESIRVALPRAYKNNELLVVLDSRGQPMEWYL